MTSPDAAGQVRHDLLLKAEVLAHYLHALSATDPDFAAQILAEITARLQSALLPEKHRPNSRPVPFERRQPVLMSSRASDEVRHDLLLKADVLAHYLHALSATDPDFAAQILAEITARLQSTLLPEKHKPNSRPVPFERRQPVLVSSRASDDVEDFILDCLSTSPLGLSVQEIVDRLEEAAFEIKRQTLVVRLHRMVQAGKLSSRAHGHYALSEAEHGRRRSP
jgi:CRP-like cAMP-binding protein